MYVIKFVIHIYSSPVFFTFLEPYYQMILSGI